MLRGDRIPGNCRTLGMEYQSTAKHLLTEECQGGVRSSEKWDYHWISTYIISSSNSHKSFNDALQKKNLRTSGFFISLKRK
jgi:hypothetical protein